MNEKTAQASPGFAKHPNYRVDLELCPRRLRVEFAGETIADSTRVRYLFETGILPVYYIPLEDVRRDLLEKTELSTHCPFKGDASYWNINVGGQVAENAVWGYETPYQEVPELDGLAAFYWDRVDHWYEEDEEIFVHPRDPRKRVDVVPSSRSVKVVLGGETVAESSRPMFLFETDLPTRYYIPAADIRLDLLTATETQTRCPYKGVASYWTAQIGDRSFADVVWSYPDPIAECPKIKDLLCFFNENVDAIQVDGIETPKPKTKWSK